MARTILIADDSPMIQNKAKGILTGEGFEVITVSNGVAAIKKMPQVKPLVVLADVSMPGKDGYEVCEFVKSSPEFHHVPVVLIISDMEDYDKQRAAQVHADGFVKKKATKTPFDPAELISTVTKFAAQSEADAPKPQQAAAPAPPIPEPPPFPDMGEEEQVGAPTKTGVDFGSVSEGIAFAEAPVEEAPAPPPAQAAPPEPPSAAGAGQVRTEEPPASQVAPVQAEDQPQVPVAEHAAPPEPVLIEETASVAPEPETPPAAERTMLFRTPVEIAEPVLTDDLAPASPIEEPEHLAPESETAARSATSLESFSLTDAAAGQVRFASSAAGVGSEGTPGVVPSESAVPVARIAALDPNMVYAIVIKVVSKLLPRGLSPQAMEETARKLTEEITPELKEEFPQN